ncbi:MAG: quaternary ammonium compound efflux SMR transporter SugE [Alphaproteobacteria bacterium]|nr:quaternary ammonium compound efflux SMR transporter SugE [Alphaproteobacteria bacterium]
MTWIYLALAGLCEIAWAVSIKFTVGFTRLWWSVFTITAMAASMYLLSLAMRSLPIGTAYAVWTGIGAVGTAILGIIILGESVNLGRIIGIALIVAGIVALKFTSDT